MKTKIRLIIITLAVLLTGSLPAQVLAEDYTASTMRLLRHEGTVEITDASGKKRAVLENVRFSSGESMTTGKESSASVGLDSDKVVTMDEQSRVEFKKKAKNMELTLTDGQLLLDVQKKLDKEEKLDVRTSTMTIGIRGTVIYVDTGTRTGKNASAGESASPTPAAGNSSAAGSSDTGSKASEETTRLGVLEGTAEVTYADANGEKQAISVPAGNKLTITDANGDGMADTEPVIEELESIDFNAFLLNQINNDPDLKERLILHDSLKEALNPDASAYKTEITLVAQSASKLYDGTPLTRTGDVLVYGLPKNFTIRASAGGSITNAGATSNPISTYTIYDANGANVTSKFTNIKTVEGQLVVDPAPVTVWTGSAEKVYDGQPLTNAEGGIGNYPVHEKDAPLWRNLSYVTIDKAQNFQVQTLYGICGTVYVHGTNPLTGENQEIALRAGQKLTVWLSDKDDEQSIEYEITDVTEEELPDEVLQIYADNTDVLDQACDDTGWDSKLMQKLIDEFRNSDRNIENVSTNNKKDSGGGVHFAIAGSSRSTVPANNGGRPALSQNMPSVKRLDTTLTTGTQNQADHVSRYDVDIIKDFADSLIKDNVNVHINIDTTITDYNNRPLGSEESRFTGIAVDPSIVVTVTGSQTDVGESLNTYSIDWGNADPANYKLSENLGTLKVTAADKTPPRPVVRSTRGGFRSTNTPTPKPINTPTPKNTATPTPKPTNTPTPKPTNTPTPTPKPTNTPTPTPTNTPTPTPISPYDMAVTFTAASSSKTYDGKPLSDSTVTVSGLTDEFTYEAAAEGEQTDAGNSPNKVVSHHIYKAGEEVTSKFTNVTLKDGTLTVNKATATVKTEPAEKTYDGTSLTNTSASITGLVPGETATARGTGSITDAGSTKNTYEIIWGTAKEDNYKLTEDLGMLTVNPLPVTFDLYLFDAIEYCGEPIFSEWIDGFYDDVNSVDCVYVEYEEDANEIKTATYGLFNLIGGGQVYLYVKGFTDAGDYVITPDVEFRAGEKGNYDITYVGNRITVTSVPLTVTTGTASKVYNGTPLTDPTITLDELVEVDKAKVSAKTTGTITEVGSTTNTYEISWGTVNPDNYNIIEKLGTLTVSLKSGLVPDDSLTGAASTLSGISILAPDTVKRILHYVNPITPGTPVTHIDETEQYVPGSSSPASQDSSESHAGTPADGSAISPTTKPDATNPGTSSAATGVSDMSAEHASGIVLPSDDSGVSDSEIHKDTESGLTSGDPAGADSSVTQSDSSSAGTDKTDTTSGTDSSIANTENANSSGTDSSIADTDKTGAASGTDSSIADIENANSSRIDSDIVSDGSGATAPSSETGSSHTEE